MISVGIDPGKDGFVAALFPTDEIIFEPCPTITNGTRKEFDERAMADLIAVVSTYKKVKVFLEKAQPMPRKLRGSMSAFSSGLCYGLWLGMLASQAVPYEVVSAKRWQRVMLADIPGSDTKARAVIACKRLFPTDNIKSWKKSDHNRADALLIAEWGRRES